MRWLDLMIGEIISNFTYFTALVWECWACLQEGFKASPSLQVAPFLPQGLGQVYHSSTQGTREKYSSRGWETWYMFVSPSISLRCIFFFTSKIQIPISKIGWLRRTKIFLLHMYIFLLQRKRWYSVQNVQWKITKEIRIQGEKGRLGGLVS